MMLIRQATREDLPAVGQIYDKAAPEQALAQTGFWEGMILSQGLLVAESGGRVIGFGTIDITAREQIKQLYVADPYQGRGVGAKILGRLEEIAKSRGMTALTLHATPSAVAFYQHAGYTPIANTADSEHDHDGVMMSKGLPVEG
jgi:GNAT superfamily N-acetyltransferase